ncbi:hypothetical protein LCGC14_0566800 [marine sediment metagenome]|uniref:Uncharacterized protein n=1 Tax=marine sediment metagenome TaxID=412755 RepID=A0A0F9UTK1_9ZZZZ
MNLVANTLCEGCDKRAELEDEKFDLETKLEEMEIERDNWELHYNELVEKLRELI